MMNVRHRVWRGNAHKGHWGWEEGLDKDGTFDVYDATGNGTLPIDYDDAINAFGKTLFEEMVTVAYGHHIVGECGNRNWALVNRLAYMLSDNVLSDTDEWAYARHQVVKHLFARAGSTVNPHTGETIHSLAHLKDKFNIELG
jgi:hypothetical protein